MNGEDDRVYAYTLKQGKWIFEPPFAVLNHNSNDLAPKPTYDGGIFKNTPAGRSPNAVVHTFYNTDSVVRTIEDLLGVNYLGFNDATASSMDDVFSTRPNLSPYNVLIPGVLCKPPVDPMLVPDCRNPAVKKTRFVASLHDGRSWSEQTNNLVFDRPDANDPVAYSHLVWRGVMGDNVPYPTTPTELGM